MTIRGADAYVRQRVAGAFALDPHLVHVNAMIMASPPLSVRKAIARHRRGFDRDPTGYFYNPPRKGGPSRVEYETERAVSAAARYLGLPAGAGKACIAQTTGTTMGLALLANGLRASKAQEVVVSVHEYSGMIEAWASRCKRDGLHLHKIRLYGDPSSRNLRSEILKNVEAALGNRTRVLALAWVHSSTGVKLPVEAIAKLVRQRNAGRQPHERVVFCVDGVHGFGVEDRAFRELGCDFFVAGCHKWIFGPRGTGVVCALPNTWREVTPTIPSSNPFSSSSPSKVAGALQTPGGVQCYECAWAVAEAFDFHLGIGKQHVECYTHGLAARLKADLARLQHVQVVTPMDEHLSSGIVCCDIDGLRADDAAKRLFARGIVCMPSPADANGRTHLRFAPSIINTARDMDRVVEAVRMLGGG